MSRVEKTSPSYNHIVSTVPHSLQEKSGYDKLSSITLTDYVYYLYQGRNHTRFGCVRNLCCCDMM